MPELVHVDTAIQQILQNIRPVSAESVNLPDSLGRTLAETIRASINLPPFPNSSMDGYALRATDTQGASKHRPIILQVSMDIPAGVAPERPLKPGEAARIMTGAPLPDRADAIIPVEDTNANWETGSSSVPGTVKIFRQVQPGENVRPTGENIRVGETILSTGTIIRPQEIGVLASLGIPRIPVTRKPRAAILSTGNELLPIEASLSPGKIYDSNSYMLAALVEKNGGEARRLPIAGDNKEAVNQLFHDAIKLEPDLIISSAGVSVGAADFVKSVVEEIGELDFWRINLKPGKPLAFGNVTGIPFFGLPGNPVSAIVTFEVIVRPALYKMAGRKYKPSTITAVVTTPITADGRRSYIRVQLKRENNHYIAKLAGTQSSGALMSMILADGLLVIPEETRFIDAGTELEVILLRGLNEIN